MFSPDKLKYDATRVIQTPAADIHTDTNIYTHDREAHLTHIHTS